jgi:Intracellular proteinase inhibitor
LVLLACVAAAVIAAWATSRRLAPVEEQPDSMRVELVVPPKVAPGAPVPIAIRIGNTADRPIELHLQGRTTTFDLTVRRGDSLVWRRLEGAATTAILQLRMLAPGEVLELKDTWLQQDNAGRSVGPGEYGVSGTVPTDGAPFRAGPVPLTIGD